MYRILKLLYAWIWQVSFLSLVPWELLLAVILLIISVSTDGLDDLLAIRLRQPSLV